MLQLSEERALPLQLPWPWRSQTREQPPKGHPPRMNDSAANTATSVQDGAWSAVILKLIKALTPNPCDCDDSNNLYLDEMPEDTNAF